MSQIRQLYTNLAAKVVTVTLEDTTTKNVACDDLSVLAPGTSQPDLPRRFLLPSKPQGGGADGFQALALGVTNTFSQVTWHLTDICLWREMGQGIGLNDVLSDLVRYAGQYVEMLADDQSVGFTSNDTFSNYRLSIDIVPDFQWPRSTGNDYFAVLVHLSVDELINPT